MGKKIAIVGAGAVGGHEKLRKTVKILCSIKGIGAITAANLFALMPEPGTLSRRQIASLAALAPHPNQSGNTDKYRCVKGGRHDVKSALFMAALSASQHHTTLRVFYQRLLAKGKLKLVALTAQAADHLQRGAARRGCRGLRVALGGGQISLNKMTSRTGAMTDRFTCWR